MKQILPTEKKTRRKSRRSQRRLGTAPQPLHTTATHSSLAVQPATSFWRVNGSRTIGGMVLLLCLWIIYLLFSDSGFYVYGAVVEGNRILGTEEIYQASQIDTLSVFWVNPNTIKANVEALPNVKTAHVKVTLPANVVISIEERQPAVIWQTGDNMWWIDNEGFFVPPRESQETEQKQLRIIDYDAYPVRPNDQVDLRIIRGAQLVHEHTPDINELLYTRAFGLVYITPEGWPVYLGEADNIAPKLTVAEAVRADLLTREVIPKFIDVRNPLRVVYETIEDVISAEE